MKKQIMAINMSFYESGTLCNFIAQVQQQRRIAIPKTHMEIMGINQGEYLDVSVKKLLKKKK